MNEESYIDYHTKWLDRRLSRLRSEKESREKFRSVSGNIRDYVFPLVKVIYPPSRPIITVLEPTLQFSENLVALSEIPISNEIDAIERYRSFNEDAMEMWDIDLEINYSKEMGDGSSSDEPTGMEFLYFDESDSDFDDIDIDIDFDEGWDVEDDYFGGDEPDDGGYVNPNYVGFDR